MYTMNDIFKKRKEIEVRRKILNKKGHAVKCHFDPRGISDETWGSFYGEIKQFLPGLTKKNFAQMLADHRQKYEDRANAVMKIEQQKIAFIICDQSARLFPMSHTVYKTFFDKVAQNRNIQWKQVTINNHIDFQN